MSEVYNTPFELSLRVLHILKTADSNAMTADAIASADFIVVYGRHFGVSEHNLHGENTFMFSEVALRRKTVTEAIRHLLLKGLLEVESSDNGFEYRINENGKEYSDRFRCNYSEEYKQSAMQVHLLFAGKSDREIIGLINQYALAFSDEGGGEHA